MKLTIRQKIYLPFKAFFDVVFALFLILLLSLVFIVFSIIIKCSSKGPVLFKQKRIGKNNKHFMLWKFRTMRIDAPHDVPTHMLDNPDLYITKFGSFLRRTSLDELPQLFNILCLKMSFVGPRPALYNQTDLQDFRIKNGSYLLRPGLTGLAQIKGRDTLPIDIKAGYDGQYFKKFNIWFDIKIFLLTFVKVFKEEGVKEGKDDCNHENQ